MIVNRPTYKLREYQQEAVDKNWGYLVSSHGNPVIVSPTGCHEKGHPILMYNGRIKAVEDIQVGDRIMGKDGSARTVLQLRRGRQPMYRISLKRGPSFVVNEDHVLHLQRTPERSNPTCPHEDRGGELVNITVKDYLQANTTFKHLHKIIQCDPIKKFGGRRKKLPSISPYMIGVFLGDGSLTQDIRLTTPDKECDAAIQEFAESHGWSVRRKHKLDNKAWSVFVKTNSTGRKCPAKKLLREVGIWGRKASEKQIPEPLLYTSRKTRLGIIAGLIDTDGTLSNNVFDWVSCSKVMAEQMTFLCRSVGLKVNMSEKWTKSQDWDEPRLYWRLRISGHTDIIPTRVPRKQAEPRKQKKNPRVYGFDIEPVGEGEYYGFTLDGDNLYVDGNFIVHHNSGKSLILAEIAKGCYENGRQAIILAHRKELLEQNKEKIEKLVPGLKVGVYSAGLKGKDTDNPIIVAGIQSCYKKAFEFGARHLIIVDEAQLVPSKDTGMYRKFFDDMQISCPYHRVVGLTATPYRLDSGLIYGPGDDQLFDAISHKIEIADLIDQGYLCPLVSKPVQQVDTSGLHHRGGEFIQSEMEELFDGHVISACEEIVGIANSCSRSSCLIFSSGVAHAEHVAQTISQITGEEAGVIDGTTLPIVRQTLIDRFRKKTLRWLVNIDVLSVGFDAPAVDLVAVLRATESPGLFYQIAGRGFRIDPSKEDCLLLDFGGNLERHGPLDSKDYGKTKKGGDGTGVAPTKICPACNLEGIPAGRRYCECGWLFPPPEVKHDTTADKNSPVLEHTQEPVIWSVQGVSAQVHIKRGAKDTDPRTLRINYECVPMDGEPGDLRSEIVSEWVCIEHEGFARNKAEKWWQLRSKTECPHDADEALDLFQRGALADTVSITTKKEGKFYRIVKYEIGDIPEGVQFEADTWDEDIPF